jgi:putative membrane protein
MKERLPMNTFATVMLVSLTAVAFSALSDEDAFFERLAQAGMAEVAAGKIAENKGVSAEVREYGAMMVKHHAAANQKLEKLAITKGVTLPATAGEENLAAMKALQSMEGARFDPAYVAGQVKAHEKAVQLLKMEIAGSQDLDTKAFAEQLLPAVESQLKEAYHLAGKDDLAAALAH